MKKELDETKQWIQERIVYIAENCDLNDSDNKRAYDNLETVLNYIDNSISKEVIEKKIEEINAKIDLAIDNSKGGLDEEFIENGSELLAQKKILQELLEEK